MDKQMNEERKLNYWSFRKCVGQEHMNVVERETKLKENLNSSCRKTDKLWEYKKYK